MSESYVPCGAWIDVPTANGRTRHCTMTAGHYIGPRLGEQPGMYAARNDESWHTDCPGRAGHNGPTMQGIPCDDGRHTCMVWADSADGAHPSETCGRCGHTAGLHQGSNGCQACRCDLSRVEATDPGWVHPVDEAASVVEDAVKESGRTLGTEITGGYRADVKIGDTGLSVYGPARFVSNVIHAFADAFVEEAER